MSGSWRRGYPSRQSAGAIPAQGTSLAAEFQPHTAFQRRNGTAVSQTATPPDGQYRLRTATFNASESSWKASNVGSMSVGVGYRANEYGTSPALVPRPQSVPTVGTSMPTTLPLAQPHPERPSNTPLTPHSLPYVIYGVVR